MKPTIQSTSEGLQPSSVHEQLHISLYNVDNVKYSSINFKDTVMPYWVISHVRQGEVRTITGNEQSVAFAGQVMIHPPEIPFSEIANVEGIHEWFMFSLEQGAGLETFRLHRTSLVVSLKSPPMFSSTFQELLHIWFQESLPFRELRATALGLQLIGMVLESWSESGSPDRSEDLITSKDRFIPVITYMNQHLHRKISREELAGLLHLHPRYLDRLFLSSYGKTPMQMLREMRIRKVKQSLESSNATLEQIAAECGMGDAAYLSRFFLKSTGQPPGKYREQAREAKRGYYGESSSS